MVPVEGVSPDRVPDSFNQARSGGRTHNATDIMAARGTPVLAVAKGRIVRLQQNALGGITLYLNDERGRFVYYYAHLDGYADPVTPGLQVEQGDIVGFVGTSGNAPPNTPHLHFQAMRIVDGRGIWDGAPVDVRPYMKKRGRRR